MSDGVTYPAEVALQWKRERDEARAAARQFFEAATLWGSFPSPTAKVIWKTEIIARWPWLKSDDQ